MADGSRGHRRDANGRLRAAAVSLTAALRHLPQWTGPHRIHQARLVSPCGPHPPSSSCPPRPEPASPQRVHFGSAVSRGSPRVSQRAMNVNYQSHSGTYSSASTDVCVESRATILPLRHHWNLQIHTETLLLITSGQGNSASARVLHASQIQSAVSMITSMTNRSSTAAVGLPDVVYTRRIG